MQARDLPVFLIRLLLKTVLAFAMSRLEGAITNPMDFHRARAG